MLSLTMNGLAERSCKKSTRQETGMRNRGCLKVLNDTKLLLNEHECPLIIYLGSIWYHSEPSDVPYSPNQFRALDFFAASESKIPQSF